jgi:acetylornithine deacetylase
MRIDREYLTATLIDLVRTNSVNPAFSDGATNERPLAERVARELGTAGLEVSTFEPEPDRVSVVGRLEGRGTGRSLMLYAHMDTVGTDGMDDPFSGELRDGKIFGRGAYDMKGGLAACIAAAKALTEQSAALGGDVLVVAVADEETASIGMQDVLAHVSAHGAVVTEPTELDVCIAHKGFCWIEVEVTGRAAHGSRFDLGIDANMRMGRFLSELDKLEQALRRSEAHPLVGPPSLHSAMLHGGTGWSTYAASSRLRIERRTVPGETEETVVGEIEQIAAPLSEADPGFKAEVRPVLTREPFEVSPDAAIVRTVTEAAHAVLDRPPAYVGQTPWMDAAFLAAAGIETVVIGPAGAGAHADEEWVELESVVRLAEILARTAVKYTNDR